MGNNSSVHLKSNVSDEDISEWGANFPFEESEEEQSRSHRDLRALERGKVRRSIEKKREEKRLRELLDEDYLLDD